MEQVGLFFGVFPVVVQLFQFGVKLKYAGPEGRLAASKMSLYIDVIERGRADCQWLGIIGSDEIKDITLRTEKTLNWLNESLSKAHATTIQQWRSKQTTAPGQFKRLLAELELAVKLFEEEFSVVLEKDTNATPPASTASTTSSDASTETHPSDNYLCRKTKRGVRRFKWVSWKGKKVGIMVDDLELLAEQWSFCADGLHQKAQRVQSVVDAFHGTTAFIGPMSSSDAVSRSLLSGSSVTREQTRTMISLLKELVSDLINSTQQLLWFYGPTCSGKSTSAATLKLELPEICKTVLGNVPIPRIVMSHVQFTGDSSELYILRDLIRQLASEEEVRRFFQTRKLSELPPTLDIRLNKRLALEFIENYLSTGSTVWILDGVVEGSDLWSTVKNLLREKRGLRVICFSKEKLIQTLPTIGLKQDEVVVSASLIESEIVEIGKRKTEVKDQQDSIVNGLRGSFGSHFGLLSVRLRTLSQAPKHLLGDIIDSLKKEVYEGILKRLWECESEVYRRYLYSMACLVALVGPIETDSAKMLCDMMHDSMPDALFRDPKGLTINGQPVESVTGPPTAMLARTSEMSEIIEHQKLASLIQVKDGRLILQNPYYMEHIVYVMVSQASGFFSKLIERICDRYRLNKGAKRLLDRIMELFPEHRMHLRRKIFSNDQDSAMLIEDLERAGGFSLREYGVFERIDLR